LSREKGLIPMGDSLDLIEIINNYLSYHSISRQRMAAVPCHKLSNIKKQAMNYNIIGIDEGQFVSFVLGLINMSIT
jgi:hypothetical protein